MPHLLNSLESQYYYDTLKGIASPQDYPTACRQLHTLFLSLINSLTEQREQQIFTGWFAKINFLVQAYGADDAQAQAWQALRRWLERVSRGASLSTLSPEVYLKALYDTTHLVHFFAQDAPIPDVLEKYWQGKVLPALGQPSSLQDRLARLSAILLHKTPLPPSTRGEAQILLTCEAEDFGLLHVQVSDIHYHNPKDNRVFRVYHLSQHCATLLRPHQMFYLTNLEKIHHDTYASTAETLLIATPDYLVDATAIAGCVVGSSQSPALYILNKLSFFAGNIHTFKGNLINQLLDDLLNTGEYDYANSFARVMQERQAEAALLAISDTQIHQIYEELQPQFETVVHTMQPYTAYHLTTEPSFISPDYGLQGRLDILVEYPTQPQRKDIIELKSGTAPNEKFAVARPEHLIQVACYNLMLQSTFADRQGVSAILYAKASDSPLRNAGKLNFEAQDAMWLRNCLVYMDYQAAKGEPKFYDHLLQKLYQSRLPTYKLNEAQDFGRKWANASALDKAYFAAFAGLTAREQWVAKVGGLSSQTDNTNGFAGLWRLSAAQKNEQFTWLHSLEINHINSRDAEIHFTRPQSSASNFRVGDVILLYPCPDAQSPEPHHYPLLRGNITQITAHTLQIRIWHKAVDDDFFQRHQYWAIEFVLMERSYEYHYASLATWLGASRQQKDMWLGLEKPRFDIAQQAHIRRWLGQNAPQLRPDQRDILTQALSCQDYFLLQGPPGTGKTSQMLRTMVDYLYQCTQEKIVLLAFTNRATDEICQKLHSVCANDFIRLGNISPENDWWGHSLAAIPDLDTLRKALSDCRVFASTVASLYPYLPYIEGATLIIDEASQLLEPALAGFLPYCNRIIFIGDEKQLPAVVAQAPAHCRSTLPELAAIGIQDLSLSIFERLVNNATRKGWRECYAMLSIQYRTHTIIADFINQHFYQQQYRIGSTAQEEKLNWYEPQSPDVWERTLAQGRILFVPSPREETPKLNRQEAQMVTEILHTIRRVAKARGQFTADTVGVITPYRAQIAEIYRLLDAELQEFVTVDTVERYQGSERDIIILSMAVNHPIQMRNLQTLNSTQTVDKKLNVALSRARQQFILLGNDSTLQAGIYYTKLLDYIRTHS